MSLAACQRMLPPDHQESVVSWGGNIRTVGYVYRPSDTEGIRSVLALGRERGIPVGLRGGGNSYGDAALNRERIVLDLTRLNRILDWDPQTGVLRAEPGVTIQQLWRHTLGDGWWPAVVPGTMFPTLGGVAAANIHGKNHVRVGPIGEHIVSADLLLPSGECVTVTPGGDNAALFDAVLGSFGILGIFTSLTLRLKRVHSGLLRVGSYAGANWAEMFALLRDGSERSEYAVGWIDAAASGKEAGRGLLQTGDHLAPGEDPAPAQTLRTAYQDLGEDVLGIPKSLLWRGVKPFLNPGGIRFLNGLQYRMGSRKAGAFHYETHAAFAFRLDYVPQWKRAYGPGGLLQYQCFVPETNAESVFRTLLDRFRHAGEISSLVVFKRHRADRFLLSYSVDGYSLAMDFKRTSENHDRLFRLFADCDRDVLSAGGRFYFAKDSHLHPSRLAAFYAEPRVQTFREWKRRLDPETLLETDLYRRLLADAVAP